MLPEWESKSEEEQDAWCDVYILTCGIHKATNTCKAIGTGVLSVLRDETPEEDTAVGSRWKSKKEGVQQWIYEAGKLFCEKNAKQQGLGRERMLRELELGVESGWNSLFR